MSAIWFLGGAFVGAFIGFLLAALLSTAGDDRCGIADTCEWRVR